MAIDNPDPEPTQEELEAAEALARALEQDAPPSAAPKELDVLSLVRFSKEGGLDKVRLQRAQNQAWNDAQKKKRFVRWAAPTFALAVAAAVLLVVIPDHGTPRALPAPDLDLLRAQANALRGDDAAFDSAMLRYRERLYQSLRAEYGASR